MADAFTRDRFDWLDRVVADHALPDAGLAVAYIMATCLNRQTGTAYPSLPYIAQRVGKSTATVRRALQELARRGHLDVTLSCGRGNANVYRPLLNHGAEKVAALAPFTKAKGANRDTFSGFEKVSAATRKGTKQHRKKVSPVAPQPFDEPFDEPHRQRGASPRALPMHRASASALADATPRDAAEIRVPETHEPSIADDGVDLG